MLDASILIPTFRRPALLRAAIRSALAQRGVPAETFEILVIDNCPDHSARATLAPHLAAPGSRLRLVHEPRPGISHARNRAVRESRGRLLAFLDDDEVAAPGWLAALLEVQARTSADAVFGPIHASIPAEIADRRFFDAYFSRRWVLPDGADVTGRAAHLGTNNSAFLRATCFPTADVFATDLGTVGGEDSLFLRALATQGRRFAWASEALVGETVSADRLSYAYVRRRRFRSGQIRALVCRRAGTPLELAGWMGVGATQALAWGLAAAVLLPLDRKGAARAATRAAGGLGKLFWAPPFLFPMYGTQAA